jgi:hypothetical protein
MNHTALTEYVPESKQARIILDLNGVVVEKLTMLVIKDCFSRAKNVAGALAVIDALVGYKTGKLLQKHIDVIAPFFETGKQIKADFLPFVEDAVLDLLEYYPGSVHICSKCSIAPSDAKEYESYLRNHFEKPGVPGFADVRLLSLVKNESKLDYFKEVKEKWPNNGKVIVFDDDPANCALAKQAGCHTVYIGDKNKGEWDDSTPHLLNWVDGRVHYFVENFGRAYGN